MLTKEVEFSVALTAGQFLDDFHSIVTAYFILRSLQSKVRNVKTPVGVSALRLCQFAGRFSSCPTGSQNGSSTMETQNSSAKEPFKLETLLQFVYIFPERFRLQWELDLCLKKKISDPFEPQKQGCSEDFTNSKFFRNGHELTLKIDGFEGPKRKCTNLNKLKIDSLKLEFKKALLKCCKEFHQHSIDSIPVSIPLAALPDLPNGNNCFTSKYDQLNIMSMKPKQLHDDVDVENLIEAIKAQPWYYNQIISVHTIGEQKAEREILRMNISPLLSLCLKYYFKADPLVTPLFFAHQTAAIEASNKGRDVILSTSTSSGKSLVFFCSVLNSIFSNHTNVAFFLFPTKALSQDQFRSLREFLVPMTATSCCSQCDLSNCSQCPQVLPMIFDGDTPHNIRNEAIEKANIFFVNPDIIHFSILPLSKRFHRIFKNLKYIIIDEAHIYRGVFGAHTAWILRRLLRLCKVKFDSAPQIIYCSATIGNPLTHFFMLTGRKIRQRPTETTDGISNTSSEAAVDDTDPLVITKDSSQRGEKTFAMWNPPTVDEVPAMGSSSGIGRATVYESELPKTSNRDQKTSLRLFKKQRIVENDDSTFLIMEKSNSQKSVTQGSSDEVKTWSPNDQTNSGIIDISTSEKSRKSAFVEVAALLAFLVVARVRCLAFCRYRRIVELVHMLAREKLQHWGQQLLLDKLVSYRAGYNVDDRRFLEKEIFRGNVFGVVCTNALELGIDIGVLDATIVLGYPGSVMAMKQQFGRAGRGSRKSISFFVAFDSPLDQYCVTHGDIILQRKPEAVCLNHLNYRILFEHILCLASEQGPISSDEIMELCLSTSTHDQGSISSPKGDPCDVGEVLESLWKACFLQRLPYSKILWIFKVAAVERGRLVSPYSARDFTKLHGSKNREEKILSSSSVLEIGQLSADHSSQVILTQHPHPHVCIRSIEDRRVRVLRCAPGELSASIKDVADDGQQTLTSTKKGFFASEEDKATRSMKILDEIELGNALFAVHPSAVYLNRGKEYLVQDLDLTHLIARVAPLPTTSDYYTKTRDRTDINVIYEVANSGNGCEILSDPHNNHVKPSWVIATGQVQVLTRVFGFNKIRKSTNQLIETVEGLNLPLITMRTEGLWIDVGSELQNHLISKGYNCVGSLHGVSHAVVCVASLALLCDDSDLAAECPNEYEQIPRPKRIMIYDRHPGGIGVSISLFTKVESLLKIIEDRIANCPCTKGCISCVCSAKCPELNAVMDKIGALELVRKLMGYIKDPLEVLDDTHF